MSDRTSVISGSRRRAGFESQEKYGSRTRSVAPREPRRGRRTGLIRADRGAVAGRMSDVRGEPKAFEAPAPRNTTVVKLAVVIEVRSA